MNYQAEFLPTAASIDATKGIIDTQLLENMPILEEVKTTLPLFVGQIGLHLADKPAETFLTDESLGVHSLGYQSGDPFMLAENSMFLAAKLRDNHFAGRNMPIGLVVVPEGICQLTNTKGIIGRRDGLLVSAADAAIINHKPYVYEQPSRVATEDEFTGLDVETSLTLIEAIQDRITLLDDLDAKLLNDRAVLRALYRAAGQKGYATLTTGEIDALRHQGDILISDYIELVAAGLGMSEKQRQAMHRSDVFRRYRRGLPEHKATAWREMVTAVGKHKAAERGKVSQSRDAYEQQIEQLLYNVPEHVTA